MIAEDTLWLIFIVLAASLFVLDLCVFNRKNEEITTKKAVVLSAFWISAGLLFGLLILFARGAESATEYYAGYIIELMMSVDNLFVFIIVFTYFGVPYKYQHKALFLGILGAIFFRLLFIFAGVQLLENFSFMAYVFGALLIITAVRTMMKKEGGTSMEKNIFVRACKKFMKVSDEYDGGKFFTRKNGVRMATPLLITVIVLELTDIMFAIDSIPAILAITRDMFIVYTSNVFAILGLRSMYFAIRGGLSSLVYLKYGLGAILVFVGTKMLISQYYHLPVIISLTVILMILTVTAVLSVIMTKSKKPEGSV